MCGKDDDVEATISNKECSYIGFIGVDDIDISYMETFDRVIKLFVDKIENGEEINAEQFEEPEEYTPCEEEQENEYEEQEPEEYEPYYED